jgi:hypothetical protein
MIVASRIPSLTRRKRAAMMAAQWHQQFDARATPDERLVRELERRGFRVQPTRRGC